MIRSSTSFLGFCMNQQKDSQGRTILLEIATAVLLTSGGFHQPDILFDHFNINEINSEQNCMSMKKEQTRIINRIRCMY